MKRIAILCFLYLSCISLNAQLIQKSELKKFNWFTDNHTKSFYKSDTISLVTISDSSISYYFELNRGYRELEYNDTNNITRIKFKRKNKLDISDHDVKSWMATNWFGWTWKFNSTSQIIIFYLRGKIQSSFIIKDKSTKTMSWKYNFSNNKIEEEIYHLLILTLVRVKT